MYRIKGFSFLAWWLAASVLVWPLAGIALGAVLFPLGMLYSLLYRQIMLVHLGEILLFPIAGAVIAFVLSSMQRWLLRSRLYWAADGWRLWSIVGGAVGGFIIYALFMTSNYSYNDWSYALGLGEFNTLLAMPFFLAFVAGCQMMPLRHAVRQPWLWLVANIVAGVAFTGLLVNNQVDYRSGLLQLGILGLSVASLGLITGFTMLHLFERHLLPMKPEGGEMRPETASRSVWDEAI